MPRDRDSKFSHYWTDLEQCSNLHMAPAFYLSTNLTQRRSALTTKTFCSKGSEATICQLRQATFRRHHNAPPTRQPASARKTSVVTRKTCNNPRVMCSSILYSMAFHQAGDFQAVSHIRNATNMSCPVHTPFEKDLHYGKYSSSPRILSTTRTLTHDE